MYGSWSNTTRFEFSNGSQGCPQLSAEPTKETHMNILHVTTMIVFVSPDHPLGSAGIGGHIHASSLSQAQAIIKVTQSPSWSVIIEMPGQWTRSLITWVRSEMWHSNDLPHQLCWFQLCPKAIELKVLNTTSTLGLWIIFKGLCKIKLLAKGAA